LHPFITLARNSIQTYLESGHILDTPADLPDSLREPGAVFVSLHTANNELRGCRGTLTPTEPTLADAIIKTAIASAVDDPRFYPMTLPEMEGLDIKIDVLSKMEPVTDISSLDEKKYGVLVQSGNRRAVLLPDIAAVKNVKQQLMLVRQKAGLSQTEPAELYRFTVTRYHANSKSDIYE